MSVLQVIRLTKGGAAKLKTAAEALDRWSYRAGSSTVQGSDLGSDIALHMEFSLKETSQYDLDHRFPESSKPVLTGASLADTST